jgi:hypothetical protein
VETASSIFYTEDGGHKLLQNIGISRIYCITSKKTIILILNTMKTSDLIFTSITDRSRCIKLVDC